MMFGMTYSKMTAGLDVGVNSVGMSAVGFDADGAPTELINAVVAVHDSGVDPSAQKSGKSRRAVSGVARRERRLRDQTRDRLAGLDRHLEGLGWPLEDVAEDSDRYLPWRIRAELATTRIADPDEQVRKLSIAVRHMARHRGWRSPYMRIDSLLVEQPRSDSLAAIAAQVEEQVGRPLPESATLPQLVTVFSLGTRPIRTRTGRKDRPDVQGIISTQLKQTDHANEIRAIAAMQGLSDTVRDGLIRAIFAAKSPKGSAEANVEKDRLPGYTHLLRAPKSSMLFQQHRIATVVANLRIADSGAGKHGRRLTVEEQATVRGFLNAAGRDTEWPAVAEHLGIERSALRGTATMTADGERASARPPINNTAETLAHCPIAPVRRWWKTATDAERAALVAALSNGVATTDSPAAAAVDELLGSLNPSEAAKVDSIKLPPGRAAYSEEALAAMLEHIAATGDDLHTTRIAVFGVPADWTPPKPKIGDPVGNPAADRVFSLVARWLDQLERSYGVPDRVVIEHVREAFGTAASKLKTEQANNKRAKANRAAEDAIRAERNNDDDVSDADRRRYQALKRQHRQCVYCGTAITMTTSELDHIIPRSGPGSVNGMVNLVAVCRSCNAAKGGTPFAVWAETSTNPQISVAAAVERVKNWEKESHVSAKEFSGYTDQIIARLKRADYDREVDARSMESVAWMATELRARIAACWPDTTVDVYNGALTSEAARASGIYDDLGLYGGPGKTRLDRRHHAVDASLITLTTTAVARVLAQRGALRNDARTTGRNTGWEEFTGTTDAARAAFDRWHQHSQALASLLQHVIAADRIPVTQRPRLRLGSSVAHDAEVYRFAERPQVQDALTVEQIDRADTPALWCALTRLPDFDPGTGLPADPDRIIRIHDKHYGPTHRINLMGRPAGKKRNGGWSEMTTEPFHHARIYRVTSRRANGTTATRFHMLRVYHDDLKRNENDDLFAVELPPQSVSCRMAHPTLRAALRTGDADYLGWVVIGDELHIDTEPFTTGLISAFKQDFPGITAWRVTGLMPRYFTLKPVLLAEEGLSANARKELRELTASVFARGWRPSLNSLLADGKVVVVRRTTLGKPRLDGSSGLPITYRLGPPSSAP